MPQRAVTKGIAVLCGNSFGLCAGVQPCMRCVPAYFVCHERSTSMVNMRCEPLAYEYRTKSPARAFKEHEEAAKNQTKRCRAMSGNSPYESKHERTRLDQVHPSHPTSHTQSHSTVEVTLPCATSTKYERAMSRDKGVNGSLRSTWASIICLIRGRS